MVDRLKTWFVDVWDRITTIYYRGERTYKDIKVWFRYKVTKENLRLTWEAFSGQAWDRHYMLELDHRKMEEMLRYFSTHSYASDEKTKRIIYSLRLAISLNEILTGRRDLFTTEGELKFNDIGCDVYEPDTSTLRFIPLVRTNLKNFRRFVNITDPSHDEEYFREFFTKWPEELYSRKSERLYWMVLEHYSFDWWD